MSKSQTDYLRHILDECNFLNSLLKDDTSLQDFLSDEVKKRAAVRSLEIIGEASKKISVDYKLKWSKIEWRQMASMRDRLIHEYMGVNYYIVWDVLKNKVPTLKIAIQTILTNEP